MYTEGIYSFHGWTATLTNVRILNSTARLCVCVCVCVCVCRWIESTYEDTDQERHGVAATCELEGAKGTAQRQLRNERGVVHRYFQIVLPM